MADPRLPARLEAQALCRAVAAAGGFAAVLAKGEPEAGTLLVLCCGPGEPAAAYERMPDPGGGRRWTLARSEAADGAEALQLWWQRRRAQDPDLWVIELDIANAQRFLAPAGTID